MNIIFAGGAGSHSFRKCEVNKAINYTLIDTNQYTIKKTSLINGEHRNVKYTTIFSDRFHGLGTGGNYKLLQSMLSENENYVLSFLKKNDLNIIVAGLSGGFGTGFTNVVNIIAKKSNLLVCFILLKPFDFEGSAKLKIANESINSIKNNNYPSLIIENQKLLTSMDRSTTIKDAFLQVDDSINLVIANVSKQLFSNTESLNIDEILRFTNCDVPLFFNEIQSHITKLNTLLTTYQKILVVDKTQEIIDKLKCQPEMVYQIDPFVFEEIVYTLYKSLGFRAELTKKSHDNGADILVWSSAPIIGSDFLTIIQAKRYAQNKRVGSSDIRDLYGAKYLYNAHKAQCITTYGFSNEAISTSQKMNIDLYVFNDLLQKIRETSGKT